MFLVSAAKQLINQSLHTHIHTHINIWTNSINHDHNTTFWEYIYLLHLRKFLKWYVHHIVIVKILQLSAQTPHFCLNMIHSVYSHHHTTEIKVLDKNWRQPMSTQKDKVVHEHL